MISLALATVLLAVGAATTADEPTRVVATTYYRTFSHAHPVLKRIKAGEVVATKTIDSAGLDEKDVKQSEPFNPLTGPFFVEGAEPGDTLEVRVRDVRMLLPYAYTAFGPKSGSLPEDFPRSRMKIIPLDAKRMVGKFADAVEVPLRPFFGSMGVAPPPELGRVSSAPPGVHAGNLDNKELVAGTTLFIPVHVKGALFAVGDGHAAQGDGEVCVTGLETSLAGTLQLVVRKDMKLKWPRAETPTHHIVMGLDKDLTEAMKLATREAIDFLAAEKNLSREEAYMLASLAVDFRVTQVVDGTKGVHGMIPKSIFKTR
jgi:acetamidase/formamidase